MKRIFSFLCLAIIASLAYSQTAVLRYTPGVTPEGVTYYLPQTSLKVTVIATRTTITPGDFHAYASRYLRLNGVATEAATEWKIDKVYLTPFGTPDTSKVYTIPLKRSTVAPLVGLTKSGIILSINTEGTEDEIEDIQPINKIEKSSLKPRDYMTQEILMAGSTAKMAELTANEIYDIRDSKSQLSKGQADYMPKDGEQLKVMMKQLDTQEEALMQLFKGTTETETKTWTFSFTPMQNMDKHILFRFSDQTGVVDGDDLSGVPVYVDVEDLKTLPAPTEPSKSKKPDERSVRYNVPSQVSVKVYSRDAALAKLTIPMGQFGRVELLSDELFNKRPTTHVTFYSTTGGLKKLEDSNVK